MVCRRALRLHCRRSSAESTGQRKPLIICSTCTGLTASGAPAGSPQQQTGASTPLLLGRCGRRHAADDGDAGRQRDPVRQLGDGAHGAKPRLLRPAHAGRPHHAHLRASAVGRRKWGLRSSSCTTHQGAKTPRTHGRAGRPAAPGQVLHDAGQAAAAHEQHQRGHDVWRGPGHGVRVMGRQHGKAVAAHAGVRQGEPCRRRVGPSSHSIEEAHDACVPAAWCCCALYLRRGVRRALTRRRALA